MREDTLIGRRLRHFEILETLGAGGMGEVYAALDHLAEAEAGTPSVSGMDREGPR